MPVSTPIMPAQPISAPVDAPSGIAADDAGATSMAEQLARESPQMQPHEKARLGAEASRDEDA